MQVDPGYLATGILVEGSVGKKQNYDLLIQPGQNIVNGHFRDCSGKKNEDKKVSLQFVNAMNWQNLSNTFFVAQPNFEIVKKRHLTKSNEYFIKAGNSDGQMLPSVYLQIEGSDLRGNRYILWITPSRLGCKGWVLTDNNQNFPVSVNVGSEIQQMPLELFKQKLFESNTDIRVWINPETGICISTQEELIKTAIHRTASQVQLLANQKLTFRPLPLEALSVLSVSDTDSLLYAHLSGTKDEMLDKILFRMIEKFTDKTLPSGRYINEMASLFFILPTDDDRWRVMNKLLKNYLSLPLKRSVVLDSLAAIFTHYQKLVYEQSIDATGQLNPSPLLQELDRDNLVNLLELLTKELDATHHQKNDSHRVKCLLKVIIPVLDLMSIRGVSEINQNKHKVAYDAIAALEDDPNLEVRYLARYGKQMFTLLPDDQTKLQSIGNRAYHLVRGIAIVLSGVSLDPKALFALPRAIFESVEDFKKVFEHQQWQKNWFLQLLHLRYFVFERDQAQFFNAVKHEIQKRNIDATNSDFIFNYLEFVWEILLTPQLSSNDIETKKAALQKLVEILDINTHGKQGEAYFFDSNLREQMRSLIITRLLQCKTHPQEAIRNEANLLISENAVLVGKEPLSLPSFRLDLKDRYENPAEPSLFEDSAKEAAPLLECLRKARDRMVNNKQLVREKPYFIPLNAITSIDPPSPPRPLDEIMKNELDGQGQVVVVEAVGGAGKTLSFKVLSNALLEHYQEAGTFPFYATMEKLKGPTHQAFKHLLDDYKINETLQEELKKRKVVFIFDNWPITREKFNIMQITDRELWSKAKFVFIGINGVLNLDDFRISTPVHPIIIQHYNDQQIIQYLIRKNVLENFKTVIEKWQREKKDASVDWNDITVQNVVERLMQSTFWKDLLASPFMLKITVEFLPGIMKNYLQRNPTAKLSDIFSETPVETIKSKLIEVYICANARRLSELSRSRTSRKQIEPEDVIKFSMKYAKAKNNQTSWWGKIWPIPLFLKKEIEELYSNNEMKAECLMYTENGWDFLHQEFQNFFISLANDNKKYQEVLENVKREDYARIVEDLV